MIAALVAVFVLLLFFLLADIYPRYMSWRSLSSARISEEVQWYIDNRAQKRGDIFAICVYALNCRDNRAHLEIVPSPDQYEFDTLRQLMWARRFKGACPGQSANLGLHVLRVSGAERFGGSDHAIWSFFNNGFIPREGHWSGGAFSEEPWERCSTGKAAYLLEEGQLVRATR